MAPTTKCNTTRKPTTTKHKPKKNKTRDLVLDLVIPYIRNVEDRKAVSLVSRKSYETDGITRKRLTIHVRYYPNPSLLTKRFPFLETLTLKGTSSFSLPSYHNVIRITPWIEQLALEFKCLKELHMRHLIVHDEDLETLARTRGKDLRSLKITKCEGFSTDGLRHVSKYCNQLKTLCLEYYYYCMDLKDGIWLHQLALNSTVMEIFHFKSTHMYDIAEEEYLTLFPKNEDLTLLAKNCCNSLISLEIGACYLSKLRDAFGYAVRLEHFGGGYIIDQESELVGFRFPPNIRSLSRMDFPGTRYSSVLPLLKQIRKLELVLREDEECECLLFKRCPNLEVLYTQDVCGDTGLQVIGKFCKKLRKLTHNGGPVTHVGVIALAKGCTKLKCLEVRLREISNESIKCLGTHLKNLRKFRMHLGHWTTCLDNGIRVMLTGCRKLESLDISLWCGGLTDVGLDYIGRYGANLRSLSLTPIGNSHAGLVKLSQGCPRLRKLKLSGCPFSEQVVTSIVFNIPSLRYVWVNGRDHYRTDLALTRREFQL